MVPFEDEKTRSSSPSLSKSSRIASLIGVSKLPEFSILNPRIPFQITVHIYQHFHLVKRDLYYYCDFLCYQQGLVRNERKEFCLYQNYSKIFHGKVHFLKLKISTTSMSPSLSKSANTVEPSLLLSADNSVPISNCPTDKPAKIANFSKFKIHLLMRFNLIKKPPF